MLNSLSHPVISGVGIDLVEIGRMRDILTKDSARFINNTFTQIEQQYCQKHADPAPHFAGTFAAKEAIRKATGDFKKAFSETEIRRTTQGKPEVWMSGNRIESLSISISHTTRDAVAIAIKN